MGCLLLELKRCKSCEIFNPAWGLSLNTDLKTAVSV